MAVIDIHGHLSAPAELYAYKSLLLASRGSHGREGLQLPDEVMETATGRHRDLLRAHGTDIQLLSPRPFQLMPSEQPARIVNWWVRANNDIIAQVCRLFPDTFRGMAGLPQIAGASPAVAIEELERCVRDLGFVGCLLNPDPSEGAGEPTPPLGDEWWYPLYAKLVELDVPALVHAAGCRSIRENYSSTEESIAILSLVDSDVFTDFPDLKIVVSHGGGSVPYQIGRWRAQRLLDGVVVEPYQRSTRAQVEPESFDSSLRKMWFDSVLYSRESLEMLLRVVGPDRVMFGTEAPGSGSPIDVTTGRRFDDVKSLIDGIDWLTDDAREAVLGENARKLYGISA
jgi:predicted TIM-barrel fold metal-dependent hydrolase